MPHSVQFTRRFGVMIAIALMLGGCASTYDGDDPLNIETASISGEGRTIDPSYTTPVEELEATDGDPMIGFVKRAAEVAIKDRQIYGAVVHLSKLYEDDPRNKDVAYNYARHLRYIGALAEAERVLNDARALHGDAPLLRLETAKLHIAKGESEQALAILGPLESQRPDDPSILQAKGVALDRAGRHGEAQKAYAKAMESGRPSAALLNNAGLSYLLAGSPEKAEPLLRKAIASPGATAQIQQNLALTLSLQGRAEEARRVGREAAPASVSDPAVEYYQTITAMTHAWSLAGAE